MGSDLNFIMKQFLLDSEINPYGDGHINHTYLTTSRKYIMQRINTNIFTKPHELMENIYNVTEHVRKKIIAEGGNPDRETLTIIPTLKGDKYYKTEDNEYYRVYKFVDDTAYYSVAEDPVQLYHAARAFGKFQNMLNDFPIDKLYETIPDFHNTRARFSQLLQAIKEDRSGRLKFVEKEVNWALEQEFMVDEITNAIKDGSVPLRVTHNDTKINNVLFDKESGKGICVIDLDTVMPGSLLYDYGDALRAGAATAAEDEKNLSLMWFDMAAFRQFTKGYLEEMLPVMTKKEIELLPLSARMLTYECGIRFLADYLNGDTYFKTSREEHNLDRARTQFKICKDIDKKREEMESVVKECVERG